MHSRRSIRESAIQFLYCSDLEGGAAAEDLCDTFWELALETDHNKLTKATAKAILHFNQGRDARFIKFTHRCAEARALINSDPQAEKLKTAFNAIANLENQWQAIVDRINRLYSPNDDTPSSDLKDALKEIFILNSQLNDLRKRWENLLQDFPLLNKQLDATKAAIHGLQRISDRIDMVQHPENFPDHPDIKHLLDTTHKITSFRSEVDALSRAVLAKKSEIDQQIADVVENYSPERIDPVDRAVLRLGCYEILFKEDIPTPIAINEAIEISRRFCSTDSPRFINGILDKIAKSAEPAE